MKLSREGYVIPSVDIVKYLLFSLKRRHSWKCKEKGSRKVVLKIYIYEMNRDVFLRLVGITMIKSIEFRNINIPKYHYRYR